MSMTISAFAQMQNWRANQADLNRQIYGNTNADPTADFATAFANAQNNFFSQKNGLAVTAMQTRLVQKAQAQAAAKAADSTTASDKAQKAQTDGKTGSGNTPTTNTTSAALTTARAAGNDILTNLGLRPVPPQKTTPSSASGPYVPPTNPATGHAYVQTSAATVGTLGAINLFV